MSSEAEHLQPYSFAKRALDVVLSATLLILLSPLLVMLGCVVRFVMGRPALFPHERAGKNGKPFVLYKFRTMTDDRDPEGNLLPDARRLTATGQTLRRYSLDELPQLVNVVNGDMSLVGPRPLPVHYLPRYSSEQRRRHDVLPGITGWAQVNGRNAVTWEERFRDDLWYVDNRSFPLDLRILALTIFHAITGTGISQEGEATMKEFMG